MNTEPWREAAESVGFHEGEPGFRLIREACEQHAATVTAKLRGDCEAWNLIYHAANSERLRLAAECEQLRSEIERLKSSLERNND